MIPKSNCLGSFRLWFHDQSRFQRRDGCLGLFRLWLRGYQDSNVEMCWAVFGLSIMAKSRPTRSQCVWASVRFLSRGRAVDTEICAGLRRNGCVVGVGLLLVGPIAGASCPIGPIRLGESLVVGVGSGQY